jgi:retron-type reverse transcriptase
MYAVLKTTSNPGAKTPGIDGQILTNPGEKLEMVESLKKTTEYKAHAVRRVYIQKLNGKMRPV